jgi:hypothetical protein
VGAVLDDKKKRQKKREMILLLFVYEWKVIFHRMKNFLIMQYKKKFSDAETIV